MPTIKDQVADIASTIGQADPAMQISQGIAKVGELAEPYITKAKRYVQPAVDAAKKALTPTPAPTDIELPKESKKKAGKPLTRSLSRR